MAVCPVCRSPVRILFRWLRSSWPCANCGSTIRFSGVYDPRLAILHYVLPFFFALEVVERAPGYCDHCGYNLRGSTSGICPECGHKASDSPPAAIS